MKIDFYVLDTPSLKPSRLFACRLIEKMYAEKKRIYIQTEAQEAALEIDELLWFYRDDSFLPHEMAPTTEKETPIQIGFDHTPDTTFQVLINLDKSVPPFYKQFLISLKLFMPNPRCNNWREKDSNSIANKVAR